MPQFFRGEEVRAPPAWTRGVTPPVEYTGLPLEAPAQPPLTKAALRKQQQADARLRRALQDAWCDPERARVDLHAAGNAYATLQDAQGLANTFVCHAQTHLGEAHLAGWSPELSLPASNMAMKEYEQAHHMYTALLEQAATRYSAPRQKSVHDAAIHQSLRPIPLTFTASDASAASRGAVGV